MKLFTIGKIGAFCEAATLSTETRKGEVVKIAVLTMKVAPFDARLAAAMGAIGVRTTLFKQGHPDPNPILGAHVDLATGCPRQVVKVFASPDTVAGAMAFDQVRIFNVHAKGQKDAKGFALGFKMSFGPLSPKELEFINAWRLGQRFCTFDEAEPGMFDEPAEEEDETDAPESRNGGLEFAEEGEGQGKPPVTEEPARRPAPRHQTAAARNRARQDATKRKSRKVH